MRNLTDIRITTDLSVLDVSMIRYALGIVRSQAIEQANNAPTRVDAYNYNKTAESYELLSKKLYDEEIRQLSSLTGKKGSGKI